MLLRARRHLLAISAAFVALAGLPGSASAAQRWASASSTDTTGTCTALAPCRVDHAVNGALTGDEIIVNPGTYVVSTALTVPSSGSLHGADGEAVPVLVSSAAGATVTSGAGSAVRRLSISASAPGAPALRLTGGTGEDLVLFASGASAAILTSTTAGTTLRDSVALSTAVGEEGVHNVDGPGRVDLVNVTAGGIAASDSKGVGSAVVTGTVYLKNVIARGTSNDLGIETSVGARQLDVSFSNFRPSASAGAYVDAGSNQSATPLFIDIAGGDLRPAAGSPTIDAGASGAGVSPEDLAGTARTVPDIGAFEYVAVRALPASGEQTATDGGSTTTGGGTTRTSGKTPFGGMPPATGPVATPPFAQKPPAPPTLGKAVVLTPASGTVLVQPPGARRPRPLAEGEQLPVGSVIDATRGTVTLVTALGAAGATQTGTFAGGRFEVRQSPGGAGMTDILLRGGDFSRCGRPRRRAAVRAFAAGGKRQRTVRRLWASDRGGRFRTQGRSSVATVRGTRWLTEDRCDGTRTTVVEGAVSVKPRGGGRARLVRAGQRFLARARR